MIVLDGEGADLVELQSGAMGRAVDKAGKGGKHVIVKRTMQRQADESK